MFHIKCGSFVRLFPRNLFLIISLLPLQVFALEQNRLSATTLDKQIEFVLSNLDKAKFMPIRQGWQYDYGFGPDSGMLNTYEYLRSLLSFESLQSKLDIKIFSEGPHDSSGLNLTDRFRFGHYNPRFVKNFHESLERLLNNRSFVSSSYESIEKYGLLQKLQRLSTLYQYIARNEREFQKYKMQYLNKLSNSSWPADGYRTFIPTKLNSSRYWNWAESAYYFWIRRDIDGTKELWIKLIDDTLQAYSISGYEK